MSLDQNLFTLQLTPQSANPHVVDLIDPSGTVYYRKHRLPGNDYKVEVYDPMSESLLITVTAPSSTSKIKVLELCNPTSVVELKYTGTLSFRWNFKWEEHEFEWKRESCYMIRKPDPPVIVAVTKEPSGRLKTTSVQILDYNLNRFDIDDRKGLEIVMLTALLTFQDSNESYHAREDGSSTSVGSNAPKSPGGHSPPIAVETPPLLPPKPALKTGIDRIAEIQAIKGEYNEIIIQDEGSVQDYAQYSSNLLKDDAILFITVKSSEEAQVPKVLQVVEETKRIRHKAGDEELYQYVLYDTEEKKGPKRIILDDKDKVKNKYAPPSSLIVHMSKISMPELQPKASSSDKSGKRKEEKKAPTPSPSSHPRVPSPRPPTTNKLTRPSHSSGSSPNPSSRVHAHQTHPNQPSPSPSQINNPSIYTAPPPRPISSYHPGPSSPAFPTPSIPTQYGGNTTAQSLYGSHTGFMSPGSAQPASGSSSSAPWQQTPPTTTQPQPSSETASHKPALSASNVVSGLFDRFHLRK